MPLGRPAGGACPRKPGEASRIQPLQPFELVRRRMMRQRARHRLAGTRACSHPAARKQAMNALNRMWLGPPAAPACAELAPAHVDPMNTPPPKSPTRREALQKPGSGRGAQSRWSEHGERGNRDRVETDGRQCEHGRSAIPGSRSRLGFIHR